MIPNAVYTRDVYRYKKDSVYFVSFITEGGRCCRDQKIKQPKMWLFDHGCVIEIIVFFDSFFAIFW